MVDLVIASVALIGRHSIIGESEREIEELEKEEEDTEDW